MPILYIHGVAVRSPEGARPVETLLRRYIADEIGAPEPSQVRIFSVYWGDIGARLAWNGASRPRSPLLGMGSEPDLSSVQRAEAMAALGQRLSGIPNAPTPSAATSGLLGGAGSAPAATMPRIRLKDLTPEQLSDLLVTSLQSKSQDQNAQLLATLAADAVAYDPQTFAQLAACADSADELALLQRLVETRYTEEERQAGGLIGQGPGWFQDMKDRVGEALSRGEAAPGFAVSRALVEMRRPLNDHISRFLGDIFVYLETREKPPTDDTIHGRLLNALAQARDVQRQNPDEALVVVSHSMGGQLVYDAVTHHLPQTPGYEDIRVDFWAAAASQVGFFEEAKLFLASRPDYGSAQGNKVPFPDRRYLGEWWNVWDSNDIISFTARDIFEGVDDEEYNSGMSLLMAHSGYLMRPSFYRRFAEKLKAARAGNWRRP